MHEPIPPTENEHGREEHPAWAMISGHRGQNSPPGQVLFDSDIRHQHTVTIRIAEASRSRDLHRDHLMAEKTIMELEMSEAQWAAFLSSLNAGQGTPCTLRRRDGDWDIPGVLYESRLQESMEETRDAAERAFEAVREAFEAYDQKRNAANLRSLKAAINNAPANVAFAGESLVEHAENVVQKARADIEAMVTAQADRLGIKPGDLDGLLLEAPADTEEQ